MSGMQDKLMRLIRGAVAEANPKLECVDRPKYANNGNLFVQPIDGLETLLVIDYAFHDTNFQIYMSQHAVDAADQFTMDGDTAFVANPHLDREFAPHMRRHNRPEDTFPVWRREDDSIKFHAIDYVDATRIDLMLTLIRRIVVRDESPGATRELSGAHQDQDVRVLVPTNAAVVASFNDEQAHDFSILTYWHKPTDGRAGYVVVEIEDLTAEAPSGEPPTPVRVRHNEASVYEWRLT